jgi:uncharacterized protein (TIGR03067 family)
MAAAMVLGVLAGAAWAGDDPEPASGDAGKLAGDWELTEIKFNGMAIPFPGNEKMIITFKKDGSVATTGGGGGNGPSKWKINAKKSPKQIDLTDGNMNTALIYKLEKGVLTIAGGQGPGGARPKDFASAEMTMTLKRKAKK